MKPILTTHPVLNGGITVMDISAGFVYTVVNVTAALTFISWEVVHVF